MIKNVLFKESETKFTTYAYNIGTMNHNTGAALDLWTNNSSSMFPTVGDTENNRDGNEIIGQGFMLRGMFNVPHDRRDVRIDYYYVQHNTNMGNPSCRPLSSLLRGKALQTTQLNPALVPEADWRVWQRQCLISEENAR